MLACLFRARLRPLPTRASGKRCCTDIHTFLFPEITTRVLVACRAGVSLPILCGPDHTSAGAFAPAFHWVCSSCLFCLRSSMACWPVVSTLSVAIGSSSLLFPTLVVERNQVLFSASGSRADLGNAADALKKKSSPGCEGRLYLDRIYRLRSCPGGRRQRRSSRLAPKQEVLWMKSSTSVEEHTAFFRYISGSSYGEPFFTLMYLADAPLFINSCLFVPDTDNAPRRLFTREGQIYHRKMNPGSYSSCCTGTAPQHDPCHALAARTTFHS